MNRQELKKDCYIETLEKQVVNVEMIVNHLRQLKEYKNIKEEIIEKDYQQCVLDLELALAGLGILLRKMSENHICILSEEMRKDINSLIHSNRFEFDPKVTVFSRNGPEEIDIEAILKYSHQLCEES